MVAYNVKTRFSVGANALIFNDKGEVLLCHRRDKDRWNFPGGAMEHGESPEEATIREAKEEINVTIEIVKPIGVYTKVEEDDIVFAFLCKITDGTPTSSDEADEIKYFSPSELPTNMSPFQIERVRDAVENHREIIFKKQVR